MFNIPELIHECQKIEMSVTQENWVAVRASRLTIMEDKAKREGDAIRYAGTSINQRLRKKKGLTPPKFQR